MNHSARGNRLLLGVLTVLIAAWGFLGWFDLPRQTWAGYVTDGDHTITRIQPDSPAERAGLMPGDVILRIAQIPVEDAARLARLPPARAGERRLFGIDRSGESLDLALTYEPLGDRVLSLAHGATIVGFCFLLFPLTAYFRRQSEASRVLTVMGMGLSLAFIAGPSVVDFGSRAVITAITTLFVLVGLAAMLQFLLVFPTMSRWIQRPMGKKLLYLPVLVVWLFLAWRILFTPPASSALNTLTTVATSTIVAAYLLLSLAVAVRHWRRSGTAERSSLSLGVMALGSVVGLGPAVLVQVVTAVAPHIVLPGQEYYTLAMVLIPLTWSRSAAMIRGLHHD